MIASLLLILLMVVLSAFFSGTEIAYASSAELRLRNASNGGGRAAGWAYWIYRHYDGALTTILIGNNLVNTATSSLATVVVITLLGSEYAWVATLLTTVLILIFGEILPKLIGKAHPERVAIASAPPLRGLMWLLHPVVVVVQLFVRGVSRLWRGKAATGPSVTEEEIEVILDTAEDEGAIDEQTTDLLQSALEFNDVKAYEIITPRVDMTGIDIDAPMDEIERTVLGSAYSRIPVFEESKDNVIGVLHVSRFLKRMLEEPDVDIRAMLMPACFISPTAPLPAVLSVMRQHKCHLVIVTDEYGGTQGILTMEDVLEELVGDIWDETDEIDDALTLLPDGQYAASGDLRLADLFDALDMDMRDFPYDSTTLGGWANEMIGETPRAGSSFTYGNVHFQVEEMQKRRVRKVKIAVVEPVLEASQQ